MKETDKASQLANNPWDEIYSSTEKYTFYDINAAHEFIPNVIDFFTQNGVRSVLDIGCGVGRNSLPLAENGLSVSAIDSSERAVKRLKEASVSLKLDISASVADFRQLPYENGSFDAVLSIQVINHGFQKDVQMAISEVARVLKPGGVFFITVPGRMANGHVRYCLVKSATKVEPNTFIPTQGKEIGQPHFIFNRGLILSLFDRFQIIKIEKDANDYYCIWGEKK